MQNKNLFLFDSFTETIGGGDENNLLCHDQEDLEETQQLRSLGGGYLIMCTK